MSRYQKGQGATKIATSWIDQHRRKKVQLAQKKVNEALLRGPGVWRNSIDQSRVSGLTNARLLAAEARRISRIKNFINKVLSSKEANSLQKRSERVDGALRLLKSFPNKLKRALGLVEETVRESSAAAPISLVNRIFLSFGVFPSFRPSVPFNLCCIPTFVSCSPVKTSATTLYQASNTRLFPLILRHLMDLASSPVRYNNSMVQSKEGITIKLDVSGYAKENITVEVESGWLVIEALATVTETGGGYVQRHMMRRYELPPFTDLTNIQVDLNEQTKQLSISVPSTKPKITFK